MVCVIHAQSKSREIKIRNLLTHYIMRTMCAYMPRPTENEATNLYLPVAVKQAGCKLADERRLSLSQLVTQLLERQLEIEAKE